MPRRGAPGKTPRLQNSLVVLTDCANLFTPMSGKEGSKREGQEDKGEERQIREQPEDQGEALQNNEEGEGREGGPVHAGPSLT